MGPSATFRLGVLTDIHLAEIGTADEWWIGRQPLGESASVLSRALDRLAALALDGMALLGDLTQNGTAGQFSLFADALSDWGTPVWAIHGNHDLCNGPDPLNPLAERRLVTTPGPTGLDVRGVRLAAGCLAVTGEGHHEAAPPEPRLWPRRRLAVWLSHFPVIDVGPVLAEAGLPHPGDIVNRAAIAGALCARSAPMLVLAGHVHARATVTAGCVLQLSFPALIEEPHELSIVVIDSDAGKLAVTRTTHALTTGHAVNRSALRPAAETWVFQSGLWRSR